MAPNRKPFIAIELRVFEEVEQMALAADRSEAEVGWSLLKLWRRCWKQGIATVPANVAGSYGPGGRIDLLVDFGFVELIDNGKTARVRGLDRYLKTADAQREAAKRTNSQRWGERQSESLSESQSESVERPENGGERREETKRRRDEDPKKKIRRDDGATQPPLIEGDPVKPKALKPIEALYESFQLARTDRLETINEELGITAVIPPDAPLDYARTGAALLKWRAAFPGESDEDVIVRLKLGAHEWMQDPYWASTERNGKPCTPYPFGAFCSGQWEKALQKAGVDK